MTTTGVVEATVDMTAAEARQKTDLLRTNLRIDHQLYIDLYRGRAWIALGYETWDAYCAGEFAEARMLRIDREQRREIVAEMRVRGMSTRAIGTALGVPDRTVAHDVRAAATAPNGAVGVPDRVISIDGRSRPSTQPIRVDRETGEVSDPPAPQRAYAPRTDVVRVISTALTRARDAAFAADEVKKEHLTNRSEEAATWSRSLSESMESLQRLLDLFTEATT